MLGNNIAFKGICTIIIFITMGVSQISLTIEDVDTDAGTLNIKMINAVGCSFCDDILYNTKTDCESVGSSGNGVWTFDTNMSQSECCVAYPTDAVGICAANAANINCPDGVCDAWFNGGVAAFQFSLQGITITDVSGGTAEQNLDFVSFDASTGVVLGVSLLGSVIPAGTNTLTTVSFSNAGDAICFAENDCSSGACLNAFSDATGLSVDTDWGDCYCSSSNPADVCGVCGGSGIPTGQCDCAGNEVDCAGICGGTTADTDKDGVCNDADQCAATVSGATVDSNGCSESQLSISQIGFNLPEEFSISQNFPNPFNPVTSITFAVAEMDEVSLVVYDLTGKEVVTLVSGTYTPGIYNVEWNAVNNVGDGIVSGMYIYRYISSEKAITRKMLYLK